MRLKLDENLDHDLVEPLRAAGHDASSVKLEQVRGIADEALFRLCREERRALVTLDLDFSDVLRYPPYDGPGTVVLRGHNNILPTVRMLIESLAGALERDSPESRLWILEPGRLRVHERP